MEIKIGARLATDSGLTGDFAVDVDCTKPLTDAPRIVYNMRHADTCGGSPCVCGHDEFKAVFDRLNADNGYRSE